MLVLIGNELTLLFVCPFRHGENCAGVIAAVLNNSNCGVGVAYKAKLGGELFADE